MAIKYIKSIFYPIAQKGGGKVQGAYLQARRPREDLLLALLDVAELVTHNVEVGQIPAAWRGGKDREEETERESDSDRGRGRGRKKKKNRQR